LKDFKSGNQISILHRQGNPFFFRDFANQENSFYDKKNRKILISNSLSSKLLGLSRNFEEVNSFEFWIHLAKKKRFVKRFKKSFRKNFQEKKKISKNDETDKITRKSFWETFFSPKFLKGSFSKEKQSIGIFQGFRDK